MDDTGMKRVRMLTAMVEAQGSLTSAWELSRELELEDACLLLDSAAVNNANAIDGAFPGAFENPMTCYDEPFPTGEV